MGLFAGLLTGLVTAVSSPISAGIGLVGVGILGAAVLLNKLSDSEEERQNRLWKNYDKYRSKADQEFNQIVSDGNNQLITKYNQTRREAWQAHIQEIENRKRLNKNSFAEVLKELHSQISTWEKLIKAVDDRIAEANDLSNKKDNELLRPQTLNLIKNNLLNIQKNQYAYIGYLKKYEKAFQNKYDVFGELLEPFQFRLPENAPYTGKVIYFSRDLLLNDTFSVEIHERVSYLYVCEDQNYVKEHPDIEIFPCLVTGKDETDNRKPYVLSCSKGKLKLLLENDIVEVEAKVQSKSELEYELVYENIKILLPNSEVKNNYRRINIGDVRRVFIKKFNNNLSFILATEYKERCISKISFNDVKLYIEEEKLNAFVETAHNRNATNSLEDWLIGPLYQDDRFEPSLLKCQLGSLVFSAEEKNIDIQNETFVYLKIHDILDENERFKPNDCFIELDVNLQLNTLPKSENFSPQKLLSTFELIYYLNSEIIKQTKIKQNRSNILFFKQWSIVMDRLIAQKQSPDDAWISIPIEEITKKRLLKVQEDAIPMIRDFYEKTLTKVENDKQKNKPMFYIKTKLDLHIKITFIDDFNFIRIIELDRKADYIKSELEENNYRLQVYRLIIPYPELKQKEALMDFIRGNVVNINIRDEIFGLNKLEFKDSGRRIKKICNTSILDNESQLMTVVRANAVDDLFFVQGPPGTGKTTVIKELIWQQLQENSNSKILIVSQANVAVDNVLRGLTNIGIPRNSILRCGNSDKVSDELKEFTIEKRIETYKKSLLKEDCDTRLIKHRKKWISLLEDEMIEQLIGENILNCFMLIGATCVGLAQKHFGLNRLEFDLVIIDEAGKALPGELLLPINRANKVIIIGDHKQLPPVIDPILYDKEKVDLSDIIETDPDSPPFFNISLFQKLYELCPKNNKTMLNTQFRMPLTIGNLVSELFYDNALFSGDICYNKKTLFLDKNLIFINMDGNKKYHEDNLPGKAIGPFNDEEVKITIQFIKSLKNCFNERIVVITPYKNQKRHLLLAIKNNNLKHVVVDTIDSFQGDEADVVIYCMTRAIRKTRYFSDYARLNVAFSRTRNMLVIIGALKYLYSYGKDHALSKIADYIIKNGTLITEKDIRQDIKTNHLTHQKISKKEKEVKFEPQIFDENEKYLVDIQNGYNLTKCKICGIQHRDDELTENVCYDCLRKNSYYSCECCKEESIKLSNYLRFVKHISPPKLCDKCVEIYRHQCVRCKKNEVIIRGRDLLAHPQWGEFDGNFRFCKECIKERNENVNCKCITCDNVEKIPLRKIEDGIVDQSRFHCADCNQLLELKCSGLGCGKTYTIKKWKKLLGKLNSKYCQNCIEDKIVVGKCIECGEPIKFSKAIWTELKKEIDAGKKSTPKRCEVHRYKKK